MYSSSSSCLDGSAAEHPSSFQPDPETSHKDDEDGKTLTESEAGLSLICSSPADHSPLRRNPSPASSSCGHHDRNRRSGHQAKRARVENIIRGMTSSPGMYCPDVTTGRQEHTDAVSVHQENIKRARSGSQCQTKQQTDTQQQQQHLRQLRTKFYHVTELTESPDNSSEQKKPTRCDVTLNTSPGDMCTDLYGTFASSSNRKHQGWKKVKLMNYFRSKPARISLMADVLKYELSRAVTRSVDSVFKSVPLLPTSPTDERAESDLPLQSVCKDTLKRLSCCGSAEVQVPDVQTEALSLVLQKPQVQRHNKLIFWPRSRGPHRPKLPAPFSHEPPQNINNSDRQHCLSPPPDSRSEDGQAKFEISDKHYDLTAVKVRSKVNCRSSKSPQTLTASVDPTLSGSLCFPHVKIECDTLVPNNSYTLNESLTSNHLKKAKLMFFYTRYPSSMVLKMCFHDVQFTRCITSQLIKWFSNFREFYYIQIEKFARHALIEGVADARGLTVGRGSELFRALNVHYNKASDFQVPERFLEVAEITLREFYIAISMGKDHDPSWKKAIYKVICKLDSEIPAEFKSHHSG